VTLWVRPVTSWATRCQSSPTVWSRSQTSEVWAPGERTGSYRDGGEVLVVDGEGESFISGADLAVAVLDEIENPRHSRENFAVGY
jgi:putative NADH-flavin reductase